jgi:hypothetical protein
MMFHAHQVTTQKVYVKSWINMFFIEENDYSNAYIYLWKISY